MCVEVTPLSQLGKNTLAIYYNEGIIFCTQWSNYQPRKTLFQDFFIHSWVTIRMRGGRQKIVLGLTFKNVKILCSTEVIIICDGKDSGFY